MKKNTSILFKISALLLGIVLMFGCAEWEEFESLDVASAPSVTVTLESTADSTVTVDVTNSMDGFVAAIILADTGNPVPEDAEALLTGNVVYDQYDYMEAAADEAVEITFSGLVQNSMYEIMAVAANEDGVVSEVSVLEVTTGDAYAPSFVEATPGFTYDPVIFPGDTIYATFDEPIMLGDGNFSFETFFLGQLEEVPDDHVFLAGEATVGVILPFEPAYGDYLWLHWEEGAVTDLVGNEVTALTTIFDGENGVFVGAYWRMAQVEMDVESFTPDTDVAQDPGFDIVLTYGSGVDAGDVADGDITLTYDDGAGIVVTVDVMADDLVVSGGDLTIPQVEMIPFGGTVTVHVPEGVLSLGFGNPNAEFSATWDVNEVSPI